MWLLAIASKFSNTCAKEQPPTHYNIGTVEGTQARESAGA